MVSDSDKIRFFNNSISSAQMNDYITILGIYLKTKGRLPSNIIIGVDPWIFNETYGRPTGPSNWHSANKYYYYFMREKLHYNIGNSNNEKNLNMFYELINSAYTKHNIENFRSIFTKKSYPIINDLNTDTFIRLSDGSVVYPYKTRFADPEEVEKSAIIESRNDVYMLNSFEKISDTELFEKLIDYLISTHINVIIFLPPYHPKAYGLLSGNPKYKIINDVETYLINLKKKYNFKLIGSYNPNKLNLQKTDFFDAKHGKISMYEKVFLREKSSALIEH
jgi:hypothetical protein